MTKLLQEAFKSVSKLPDTEQNVIAKWLLEEIKAEKKWDQSFAESEDILGMLADEALQLHSQKKTTSLRLDKL